MDSHTEELKIQEQEEKELKHGCPIDLTIEKCDHLLTDCLQCEIYLKNKEEKHEC